MHELATQQEDWDVERQFDAINRAVRDTRPQFRPLRDIGGAALIATAIALIMFGLVAVGVTP